MEISWELIDPIAPLEWVLGAHPPSFPPFPQLPLASMKYATAVQVPHDAERTPPPLVVVESHPSHIKVHKPNVSGDLGVWLTCQHDMSTGLLFSWEVCFRITYFFMGGVQKITQVWKRVLQKKGQRFLLEKPFSRKRAKANFLATSSKPCNVPKPLLFRFKTPQKGGLEVRTSQNSCRVNFKQPLSVPPQTDPATKKR